MGENLLYIPNDDRQKLKSSKFSRQLLRKNYYGHQCNKCSLKVPKDSKPTNKNRYCKILGTILINSPMSPPSLYCKVVALQKIKVYWHKIFLVRRFFQKLWKIFLILIFLPSTYIKL